MNEIELKISQLIDNELNDAEQLDLFAILSQNKNARIAFDEFMKIKKETTIYYSGSTSNFDLVRQIKLPGDKRKNSSMYKVSFYFSVAAALVLAVLLLFNLNSSNQLRTQINSLLTQNQFLSNKLPVKPTNVLPALQKEKKNERKITNKLLVHKKDNTKRINSHTVSQTYHKSFQINKVIVTNEDFIGGKIVAN